MYISTNEIFQVQVMYSNDKFFQDFKAAFNRGMLMNIGAVHALQVQVCMHSIKFENLDPNSVIL